jgi:two-component flavin-dependent monooxygenase/oxygenase LndZ5
VSQKLGTLKPGGPGLSRSAYQSTLARSAGEIDAAGLLLERVAVVADRGAGLEQPLVARNLRDCSLSIDLMVSAMDRLFRAAGTTGQSAQSPFQRFWRDVNCVGGHASLQFEPAAIAYAETVLH